MINLQQESDTVIEKEKEKEKELEDEEKAIFYKNEINDVFCGKGKISSIDNYSTTCVAPDFKVNKCIRDISDIFYYSKYVPSELKSYLNKELATKKSTNLFYANANNCMLACNYAREAAINDPTFKEYYCNSVVYVPPTKTETGKCYLRNEKENNPFKEDKCHPQKGAITYSSYMNEPYLTNVDTVKTDITIKDMNKCHISKASLALSSSSDVYINKSEPIIITEPTPNPCDEIPKPICPTPCPQNNCPFYPFPPMPPPVPVPPPPIPVPPPPVPVPPSPVPVPPSTWTCSATTWTCSATTWTCSATTWTCSATYISTYTSANITPVPTPPPTPPITPVPTPQPTPPITPVPTPTTHTSYYSGSYTSTNSTSYSYSYTSTYLST